MPETLSSAVVFAQAAEEEGGSFLVSPDVGLMLWTLAVFAISIFLLGKFAFPRIAEALDRRQRAIEESIETAERTKTEAEQLLGEYRERLAEARADQEAAAFLLAALGRFRGEDQHVSYVGNELHRRPRGRRRSARR